MITKIGLDLGYANITLSDALCEIYREPSVALIQKEARSDVSRVIAVGEDAMNSGQGDEGFENGILVRPFKNGILFDHQLTSQIINKAVSAVGKSDKIRCVVGVPSDFLQKQERELFSMLASAGVDNCLAVARPIAALIGAGYSPNMSVISVNIGALSTEIAVIHKGKILIMCRESIGGENFDRAVKQYVLDQGEVNISLSVARAIKEKLGAVWRGNPNESIDIEGTLALTGNRLKMNVTTEDIVGVFEEPLRVFIDALVKVIRNIPSDAVEDIFSNGIILTGGGAELFGIDILIEKVLGIPVAKPHGAIDCVAKGLSRINSIVTPRYKVSNKNITEDIAEMYSKNRRAD